MVKRERSEPVGFMEMGIVSYGCGNKSVKDSERTEQTNEKEKEE
jgi:hypothetical protein